METDAVFVSGRSEDTYVDPYLVGPEDGITIGSEVLSTRRRVLIIGDFGAGKTTLLRARVRQAARRFIEKPEEHRCPIYVPASEFRHFPSSDLLHLLLSYMGSQFPPPVPSSSNELFALLNSGLVELTIDGLDELPQPSNNIVSSIVDLFRRAETLNGFLATRPSALTSNFPRFETYTLRGFDQSQIREYLKRASKGDSELATHFLDSVSNIYDLSDLVKNPLLLNIMWAIYAHAGTIPYNISDIYAYFVDLTLNREREKRSRRIYLSGIERLTLLGRIAVHQFETNSTFSTIDVVSTFIADLPARDPEFDVTVLMRELIGPELFLQTSDARISFMHTSFMEYFVAWHFRSDPHGLISLLRRRYSDIVCEFAAGLLEDVAPLAEFAIETQKLSLAAKCVSVARKANKALAEYVVREFRRAVGEPFIAMLVTDASRRAEAVNGDAQAGGVQRASRVPKQSVSKPKNKSHQHARGGRQRPASSQLKDTDLKVGEPVVELAEFEDLLRDLDGVSDPKLSNAQRGSLFETFASGLFGRVFKVVRRNESTRSGEFDLILNISEAGPWWFQYGGDALVECKNWKEPAGLPIISLFRDKMKGARIKVGFVFSINGFTEPALRAARERMGDVSDPLVIPLSGEQVRQALQQGLRLDEFFQDVVREIRLQTA